MDLKKPVRTRKLAAEIEFDRECGDDDRIAAYRDGIAELGTDTARRTRDLLALIECCISLQDP